MFYTLKDGDPEIDSMMASVCAVGGQYKRVSDLSLSFQNFPETKLRASESVQTAKRTPTSDAMRKRKHMVYSLQYNRFRRVFEADPDAVAVAWNGITGTRRAFMAAAKDAGRKTLYMERSPLPGTVTVDPVGINQQNSLPRDASFYREWSGSDPSRTGRDWLNLKAKLQARAGKRADVQQGRAASDLNDRNYIFCPLQVPDDTQIRQFSGWVGDIESFISQLAEAAKHLPDGWHLRFKEHPSSKIPLGAALEAAKAHCPEKIVIDNQSDTFQQVENARAVVTLNSSVGLQAFYFERPVLVLGQAFFRIPGLVTPVDDAAGLHAQFAQAEGLEYDAAFRNSFMNYLEQVYYPKVSTGSKGRPVVDSALVRPKLIAIGALGTE